MKVEHIVEAVFSKFEEIGGVRIPRIYVGSHWNEGPFGSVSWYVKQAYDPFRKQVLTSKLWSLFEKEPYQKMNLHYELMILETDLYSEGTNFLFGETRNKVLNDGSILEDKGFDNSPNVMGVILSTNRIKKWYGDNWELSFYYILAHELGHFFGLPTTENPNFIFIKSPRARNRLDYCHCDDRDCVMEQVNIEGRMDLLEKALHLKKEGKLFCKYDLEALVKNLRKV